MSLNDDCQNKGFESASAAAGSLDSVWHRLLWHLQHEGVVVSLRKAVALILRHLAERAAPSQRLGQEPPWIQPPDEAPALPAPSLSDPPLDLLPGDWVEVKSMEEILLTLDSLGRCQGLVFMPAMSEYCGRRARVLKRVDRIILEHTGEARTLKHTVLLDDAICSGAGQRCDRGCFYFWREAWLRRIGA